MRYLAVTALLLSACSKAPVFNNTPILPKDGPLALIMPAGRIAYNDVVTGGQPSRDDIGAAAAIGVNTVINLRTAAESPPPAQTQAWVDEVGLGYVHLPVDGLAGITRDNADKLRAALAEAKHPVLVHCSTGNRVAALFALIARGDGMSADAALAEARRVGVTRPEIEAKLKTLLQ